MHPIQVFLEQMKAATIADNASARARGERGIMTLGELTTALKAANPKLPIMIDEGGHPGDFDSYRGYYDHLAIEYGGGPITVGDFLDQCLRANRATFTGYKGGDFVMDDDTPIWVSTYGESSGVALVGVSVGDDEVQLITEADFGL